MNARKTQKSAQPWIPVVLTFACLCSFISLIFSTPVAAAENMETRGYVISMVHTATYVDAQTCPQGTNGLPSDILLRRVIGAGYSEEEAFRILTGGNGGRDDDGNRVGEATTLGSVGGGQGWNGLDFNPANFPSSLPDPEPMLAQGRFALGLDLDGKVGPDSWQHPETSQQGIDNQMWRVLGCWDVYNVNKPVQPYNESIVWDTAVDAMPAWLVSVSGEDLTRMVKSSSPSTGH